MAGLFKHFQLQPLPSIEETGLGEILMKEVTAMERVLEEEQNGAEGQKRKYSHLTTEQTAKERQIVYIAECGLIVSECI